MSEIGLYNTIKFHGSVMAWKDIYNVYIPYIAPKDIGWDVVLRLLRDRPVIEYEYINICRAVARRYNSTYWSREADDIIARPFFGYARVVDGLVRFDVVFAPKNEWGARRSAASKITRYREYRDKVIEKVANGKLLPEQAEAMVLAFQSKLVTERKDIFYARNSDD